MVDVKDTPTSLYEGITMMKQMMQESVEHGVARHQASLRPAGAVGFHGPTGHRNQADWAHPALNRVGAPHPCPLEGRVRCIAAPGR